jgi:hypothetical protein
LWTFRPVTNSPTLKQSSSRKGYKVGIDHYYVKIAGSWRHTTDPEVTGVSGLMRLGMKDKPEEFSKLK